MIKVNKSILKSIYKKRPEDARKYDYGLLLVIGGSEFYSGSPALSALAAFKTGVDMVRIIAPKRAADIIASFSPNLAAYPLEGLRLNKEYLTTLISMTKGAEAAARGKAAVVIGGGIGRSQETQEAVLEYLSQVSVPVVVDADGIHALGKKPETISDRPSLITPHAREFFVLTGKEVAELSDEEKIRIVQEEAGRLKTTILLKGKIDIISNGKEVVIAKAGSPYMTVGGMGDTLAGVCGALLARGVSPFEAAQAGILINDLAGEIACKKLGESVMATDLIEAIPQVIKGRFLK